jgi:uncharacterized protein YkwD
MEDRVLRLIVGVVVLLAATVGSVLAVAAADRSGTASIDVALTADEKLVLQLANAERVERDLPPLRLDPLLVQVARHHSRDMAEHGYFAHISPSPALTTPLGRYEAVLGRKPKAVVGENIGRAEQPLMGRIHASMMRSPDHKSNILDVEYTRVGVGIFAFSDGQVWVTQMFRGEETCTR